MFVGVEIVENRETRTPATGIAAQLVQRYSTGLT